MTRSTMFRGDQAQEEPTSPRTTIVGGRPPEQNAASIPVPNGLPQLLRMAAIDEAFKTRLIEQRSAVAASAGVALTASEKAILDVISAGQLTAMVGQIPEPPAARREFLRQTAASAVVLLGGAALGESTSGCKRGDPSRPRTRIMDSEGGIAPHAPPGDTTPEAVVDAAADQADTSAPSKTTAVPTTEVPPSIGSGRPDKRDMLTTGGAAPDVPPPRPKTKESGAKGGARADTPGGEDTE